LERQDRDRRQKEIQNLPVNRILNFQKKRNKNRIINKILEKYIYSTMASRRRTRRKTTTNGNSI
jgi:hypothetical protein